MDAARKEGIVLKWRLLRQIELAVAIGKTTGQACEEVSVTEQTC
jgi:hypothetical protein